MTNADPKSAYNWTRTTPLVVFGDDWGRSVSTMQHLFRFISAEFPVVWVNAIGHRAPQLSVRDVKRAIEKVKAMTRPRTNVQSGSGLTGGSVPLSVIEPKGVLPWHGVGVIHRRNTELLVTAIQERLESLGLREPPVIITGTPPSVGVLGRIGELGSIYFCMDDFLNFPGVDGRMIAPLEKRLREKIDILVATARSLTETKKPATGETYHLPQGVNFEHFSAPQSEPEDIADMPKPRIGFAGTVGGCCDLALVAKVARAYPQCGVVLAGVVTADDATIKSLPPNVRVLGARPYSRLPGYVQHFDVGIIPYVLNDYTRAVDPLKLLEYLASGIPVVSSKIPEVEKYADQVFMADTDEAFIKAVGDALALDRKTQAEHGRAFASGHTWRRRADRLLGIIDGLIARKKGGQQPARA